MSAMATTLRRNPSLRAGIIGAILGSVVTFGTVLATNVTPSAEAPLDAVVVLAPRSTAVQRGLRNHQVREYGATAPVDTQTTLQEHLTRERRSTGAQISIQDSLSQHVLRENSEP